MLPGHSARDCPDRFAPRGMQGERTTIVPCGPLVPVCDGQRQGQIKTGQLHGALFYRVVVSHGREERQVEVQEQGRHECLLCVSDLW